MKPSSLVLALAVSASLPAQNGLLMSGNANWNGVGLTFETVLSPPTPPMAEGFVGGNITDSAAIHRYLFYNSQQKYFGYDLLVEPVPKTDFYKLTFRPMTVADPKRLEISHPENWTKVPLSGYPAPQMVKVGDLVTLELFKNRTTGQSIGEVIRVAGQKGRENQYVLGKEDVLFINVIHQPDASGVFVVRPDGTIPLGRFGTFNAAGRTVDSLTASLESELARYFNHPKVNVRIMTINGRNASGSPRDLSLDDVDLRIIAPQVSLNGKHMQLATYEDGVAGPAVWFYLPDHGRYLLSLVPRPQLGFVRAGEVRGSTLSFTIDGETIGLTSGVDIAPGFAPYNLYVFRQSAWRPTEDALMGTFLMGYSEQAEALLQAGYVQISRTAISKTYVSGQVRKPGAYALNGPKTVLEAIIEAGGPTDFAKTRSSYVLRGHEKLPFNYFEVTKGRHLEQNIVLKNGDVVVVPGGDSVAPRIDDRLRLPQ
jgi:protein involved in polysaccharide export with SLBB domain